MERRKSVIVTLLSFLFASVFGRIINLLPINIFLLLVSIILLALIIYLSLGWYRGRKLLIKILPEKKMAVPVDGRDLNIIIYNKNNFDVECEIVIEFPKFLEVYSNDEEEVEKEYKKRVRLPSMHEDKTTLKLIPNQYGKEGYIYYTVKSAIKEIKDKVRVST